MRFISFPWVVRAVKGTSERIERQLGFGLQVSSITMTAFYILLLYIWKQTFYEMQAPAALEIVIWASAILGIRHLPPAAEQLAERRGQSEAVHFLRNAVFAVTGIGVIALYAISGNTYGYHMTRMVAAILISFGCYLPVTLLSRKMPKVGLLMIPKTCAYIWIIVMGLQLLFRA